MNKSRRKFLAKGPSIAAAAGVGIASGKLAMASPAGSDGTRPLLDDLIDGQARINGRLYYSSELMLDVLRALIQNTPGIDLVEAEAKLAEAGRYIYAIPEIRPPGCKLP